MGLNLLRNKKKKTNGELNLSKEEKEKIANTRAIQKQIMDCIKAVDDTLRKHNCVLQVDRNSTLNNLKIVVAIKV